MQRVNYMSVINFHLYVYFLKKKKRFRYIILLCIWMRTNSLSGFCESWIYFTAGAVAFTWLRLLYLVTCANLFHSACLLVLQQKQFMRDRITRALNELSSQNYVHKFHTILNENCEELPRIKFIRRPCRQLSNRY